MQQLQSAGTIKEVAQSLLELEEGLGLVYPDQAIGATKERVAWRKTVSTLHTYDLVRIVMSTCQIPSYTLVDMSHILICYDGNIDTSLFDVVMVYCVDTLLFMMYRHLCFVIVERRYLVVEV